MSQRTPTEHQQTDVDYRVVVAYNVPVEVIVDLDEGRVQRAVVIDERIALDQEEGARQETTLRPIPSPVAKRAIEIAEAGEWPAWERGY